LGFMLPLAVLLLGLILVMATGLPVAYSFMLVNIVGVFFLWGGTTGFYQLVLSIFASINMYPLVCVAMFVLMGEVLFQSGTFPRAIDVLDKWMGRLPGRLGLVAIAGATLFSTLSGSSLGTTAMLGSVLVPEMERRGYKKEISIGACMSGGLAMIIPPSALAVILATLARLSVGKILMAGVIPGLIMAATYVTYIVGRCALQPSMAPAYTPVATPLSQKFMETLRYVLPFGAIILLVIGFVVMGLCDPTEASAVAALAVFVLAAIYRRLNWHVVKKAIASSLRTCVMMFFILTASTAFSQILAFTGATRGLTEFVAGLQLPPFVVIIAMQFLLLILGCFMEQVSIMMITFPIYMPVIGTLGFDPIWFALMALINMEVGLKTPPFGFLLFVMKGVAPPDTTMGDIYRAVFPFVLADILAIIVILVFPPIATWLPGLVR
jgi:tripartite ATP-independent transporter DctM subunit